jgi:hypothetical protein
MMAETLAHLQAFLDEHRDSMPEGVYLELCNHARDVYGLNCHLVLFPRLTPATLLLIDGIFYDYQAIHSLIEGLVLCIIESRIDLCSVRIDPDTEEGRKASSATNIDDL